VRLPRLQMRGLPVRVESLWWMRGLRRLLRSLGTLPLVLDATECARQAQSLAFQRA
jgi:hypothetical protein